MSLYQVNKIYPKECAKLHLSFGQLLDHLHIMAKYWNKVRKAKKRTYERLQKSEEIGQFNLINSQRNLFNANKDHADHDNSLLKKDEKLVQFYDYSIDTLKTLLAKLNIPSFEK